MIWIVVWTVLMMMWLFGGSYQTFNGQSPNFPAYGTNTLIPWFCVLILGLVLFGGINVGPSVWR